jgi:hypothetical protein
MLLLIQENEALKKEKNIKGNIIWTNQNYGRKIL